MEVIEGVRIVASSPSIKESTYGQKNIPASRRHADTYFK
jgi:hypothetical protein